MIPAGINSYRRPFLRRNIFHPSRRSLVRGCALVLSSLIVAVLLSGFPENHATLLLIFPAIAAVFGTADTIRCLQPRWNFYHAGVVLCIYMDLMAVGMIFFLLLYPYLDWLSLTK